MHVQGISSTLLGGSAAVDPAPKTQHTPPTVPNQGTTAVAPPSHVSNTAVIHSAPTVPPHAQTTIYNAKGETKLVPTVTNTHH
jgi:hypothetical protein